MQRKVAVLLGAMLLLPAAMMAANAAGRWEGAIKTPQADLGVVLNLHRDGDQWAGEMDIPDQHVSELPLKDVKVDGAAVRFSLSGAGDASFDGKLSEDGKTISGNFSQGGASLPLTLTWKSEPKAVSKAPANSGEVQALEGVWEGAMDANGAQLRLRFHFTKNADGSITGTVDSLDQGADGIPIASIAHTGDTVKLEVKVVGGSYEGTLNKDASTLTGTWSQGGNSLPLTLQRRKANAG
jgi:hypothetical protein